MDINKICFITAFILIIGLMVIVYNIYSVEGDIKVLTGETDFKSLENKYNHPNKICSRLYDLIVVKNNYVYWVYYLLIAVIASLLINLLITHIYKVKMNFTSFLFSTAIIFISIEIPRRFIFSHMEKKVETEGTNLINLLYNKYF